jgi:alginate production protein
MPAGGAKRLVSAYLKQVLRLSLLLFVWPAVSFATSAGDIVPGHWLQVRGELDEQGVFQVQRLNLIEPRDEEEMIGRLSASSDSNQYLLFGQRVVVSDKTRYRRIDESELAGARVKVEGHYRGPKRFSARSISRRDAGRERITGQVISIDSSSDGYVLAIMNNKIRVPADIEVSHEQPFEFYTISPQSIALRKGRELSEEDRFGNGIRLSKHLRLTSMLETRYTSEDNYNLNDSEEEGRQDLGASARARLILEPTGYGLSGQLEFRYTHLQREDDKKGRLEVNDTRLGESFIFLDDLFDMDFDIQAGRMDFDDRREWIYDQNLDGLRAYWDIGGLVAEFAATTTLSDGDLWDENTDNYVIYLTDQQRRYAAWMVHRDTSGPYEQEISHFGVRAFGTWPERHNSWLEISGIHGRRDDEQGRTNLGGWGMDIGTTREISRYWYLTTSWAYGQGDDDKRDGSDRNFRQTGLQDNNAKFSGVTSFRYYGELVDPELANLHIGTLGLGYLINETSSLDVVGHYYRQDKAVRKLLGSDLDEKANGVDRELGWEVDAILGLRPVPAWDIELVLGWFNPGKAFEEADQAWLGKVQLRYRY